MWSIVDRIDEDHCTSIMPDADDLFYLIDRAHGIRGIADRQQAGMLRDVSYQVCHVQSTIRLIDVHETNPGPTFFKRMPGGDISIVVEMSKDDLVTRSELAANRPTQGIRQRGHIGAEENLVRVTAQKIGHGHAGFGRDSLRPQYD